MRFLAAISLTANVALAAVLLLSKRNLDVPKAAASVPHIVAKTFQPTTASANANPATIWASIEAADYSQYIANLRAVECPEWLARDIIVARIDGFYQQNSPVEPPFFVPWQSPDDRRKTRSIQSEQLKLQRHEKRMLVKALVGYEWEDDAEKLWNQNLLTSLTLGFLPDEKVGQILRLQDDYEPAAQKIREDAGFILIDEDRTRLLALYENFKTELSGILNGSELDEFQLRAQQGFFILNDVHFDGMTINRDELRQIIRLSKSVVDMAQDDFANTRPLSEGERTRRMGVFNAQVKNLLGTTRYADYERAQDFNFREIFAFCGQNQLPQTVANKVYDLRKNADMQADEIRSDGNLSVNERATALSVLKLSILNAVSSASGDKYQTYLDSSGEWIEAIAPQESLANTQ